MNIDSRLTVSWVNVSDHHKYCLYIKKIRVILQQYLKQYYFESRH